MRPAVLDGCVEIRLQTLVIMAPWASRQISSCLRFFCEGITSDHRAPAVYNAELVELGYVTAAELHAPRTHAREEESVVHSRPCRVVIRASGALDGIRPTRSRVSCSCRCCSRPDLPELLDAFRRGLSRAHGHVASDRAVSGVPRRIRVSRGLAGRVVDAAAPNLASARGTRHVRDRGQCGRVLSDRLAGRVEPAREDGRRSGECAPAGRRDRDRAGCQSGGRSCHFDAGLRPPR